MKEPRDEFLEQIKKTLLGHEEPYDEGAWERFAAKNLQAKNKKPVVPIWKWAAAAAAVLAGALILLQYFNAPDVVTKQGNSPAPMAQTDATTQPPVKDSTAPAIDNNAGQAATDPDGHLAAGKHIHHIPAPVVTGATAATTNQNPPLAAQPPKEQQPAPAEKPAQKGFWETGVEKQDVAVEKPAQQENKQVLAINQSAQKRKEEEARSKWKSSLYVSPNFAGNGINMGYGYSLGYAVNDKIRISSGIAYTKVSTSKHFHAPERPDALAVGAPSFARSVEATAYTPNPVNPYLQSMDSWISGIDVPVEVTYDMGKVYATGGVSGLFVLNGEDNKKYIPSLSSRAPVLNNEGNVKEYTNVAMEDKPVSQPSPNNTSFLGFYNVSMGFRQKISNKNSVSVEPFIKVPMQQVTEQKLNFTGAGVRLKFDF